MPTVPFRLCSGIRHVTRDRHRFCDTNKIFENERNFCERLCRSEKNELWTNDLNRSEKWKKYRFLNKNKRFEIVQTKLKKQLFFLLNERFTEQLANEQNRWKINHNFKYNKNQFERLKKKWVVYERWTNEMNKKPNVPISTCNSCAVSISYFIK